MSAVITLTTDFGTADAYVASMKGRILCLAPACRLVDVTHQIPPGDILRAGLAVRDAAACFPDHTIHLVVVDPGVGTTRRAIVARGARFASVGPDNGVLSLLWGADQGTRWYEIDPSAVATGPVSRTFHGRDLFAPAAALLALGLQPGKVGTRMDDPVRLELPSPRREPGRRAVEGEVLYADRFGNLVTNLSEEHLPGLPETTTVEIGGARVHGVVRTYGQGSGGLIALFGSTGLLEVAVRDGSAQATLGVGYGAAVRVVDEGTHGGSG